MGRISVLNFKETICHEIFDPSFFTSHVLNLCGRGVLYTSVSDSPGHNDISELDTAVLDTSELDTAELDTAELDTAELDTSELDTAVLDTSELDTAVLDTAVLDTSELDTAVLNTSELDNSEIDTAELDTAVLRSRTYVVESNNQKRKIHNIIDPVFCMIQTQEFEDISQRFFFYILYKCTFYLRDVYASNLKKTEPFLYILKNFFKLHCILQNNW